MTIQHLRKQLAASQAEHQSLVRATYQCEGAITLLQHLIQQSETKKAPKA